MIRDSPQGADLLAEASRVLTGSILPHLSSGTRYQVLMTIRAINLAESEFRASDEAENRLVEKLRQFVDFNGDMLELSRLLSTGIRDGKFDASDELHALLQMVVTFKFEETNPPNIDDMNYR